MILPAFAERKCALANLGKSFRGGVFVLDSSSEGCVMSVHRKLIRSSIKDVKGGSGKPPELHQVQALTSPPPQPGSLAATRRKQIPAEQTNAESFYYLKQMQTKTAMVIIMEDGEQIRGIIEWYDRHTLKVNRHKEPNLMIMKQYIKYMYKQEEEIKHHRRRKRPAAAQENEAAEN